MLVRVRDQVQEVLRPPRVHADAGTRSCPMRAPDRATTSGSTAATHQIPARRTRAEQVTLSMLANEPGHSFTYRHDLDHDRACNVVVEEITAVDPAGNDVVVFGDEPGPDRSSQS